MTNIDLLEVLKRLESLDANERQEVFNHLRKTIHIHALEEKWKPNEDWTDDFSTSIEWLREGRTKTIYPGKM